MIDIVPERRLQLSFNDAPPEPWEAPLPELPATKPRILLPGKDRLLSAFALELAQNLQHAQLYRKGDKAVFQKSSAAEFGIMTGTKFVTWVERSVECYEGQLNADGSGIRLRSINKATADTVLNSEQFLETLPTVESCNQIRQPVIDRNGNLRLLPTGYDTETRILTARGGPQYPLGMTLTTAREYLNKLLSEFCFSNSGYGKAVQVAAMITAYGMGLLSRTSVIPAFVFNANEAGAGKGLCVNLALIPVLGMEPAAATIKSQDEMGKWLFAAARAGERFLFLDNIDIPLADPHLEKFLTSSRVSARVLCSSDNQSLPKQTMVIITGNRLTMRSDMRRRSLVVELFLPQARAEARQIQNPMDVQHITAESPQILGCLHALVREWVQAGKPGPTRLHPSFMEWSAKIGGIVQHAGFECPIPCLEITADTDPEVADMERLVAQVHAAAKPFGLTFREIVEICQQHGLFEGQLPSGGAERNSNTAFSRLLKRFNARIFCNLLTFHIRGNGHARRYTVQAPAAQDSGPSGGPAPSSEPVTLSATPYQGPEQPEVLDEPLAEPLAA